METVDITARERQVLELVGAGLRDEQVAAHLGIARSTVALLLRSAMAKSMTHPSRRGDEGGSRRQVIRSTSRDIPSEKIASYTCYFKF